MISSLFFKRLSVAGLIALLALATGTYHLAAADASSATSLYDNLAALSNQRAKSASGPTRQLGLVRSRLDSTRGLRVQGRNLNASSLAMRFSGGSTDESAVIETKKLIAPEKERRTRRLALWFGGDVVLDSARAEDPRHAAVYTSGLAFGADMRLGSRLLVGNAVGAAFDRTGFGAAGSLETRYLSNTLYGSLTTSPDTYLDIAIGASRSEFLNNYGASNALPASHRSSSQFFGQARYSHRFQRNRHRIRSYGEARFLQISLDDYVQHGTYFCESQSSDALELALGVRGETSSRSRIGKLSPHAVVEVSRTLNRTSGVAITSAEGIDDHVTAPSFSQSGRLSARTGFNWAITDRAAVNGEYSVSSAITEFNPQQRVTAEFKLKF